MQCGIHNYLPMTHISIRSSAFVRTSAVAGTALLLFGLGSLILPVSVLANGGDNGNGNWEHQDSHDNPDHSGSSDGHGKIIVQKIVVGTSTPVSNFSFTITKGNQTRTHQFKDSGATTVEVDKGTYAIAEVDPGPDYTVAYSGACQSSNNERTHSCTVGNKETKTCTITNTWNPPVPQSCEFVSDATTQEDGHDSVVETPNPAWATLSPAFWIWGEVLSDADAHVGSMRPLRRRSPSQVQALGVLILRLTITTP